VLVLQVSQLGEVLVYLSQLCEMIRMTADVADSSAGLRCRYRHPLVIVSSESSDSDGNGDTNIGVSKSW